VWAISTENGRLESGWSIENVFLIERETNCLEEQLKGGLSWKKIKFCALIEKQE